MITLYAYALILPMSRVIGLCIMTYIILLCRCFRFIACFFYKFCFVPLFIYIFIFYLTLHVLFFSVLKNSKTHKIEKYLKSLIACVVYITCKFDLVPSY